MTDKVRVMICDKLADGPTEELKKLFDVEEIFDQTPEALADTIGKFDAIVVRSATKVREVALKAAVASGKTKLVIRGGVGIDNIDAKFAKENGIAVMNTPAASSISVAELAFGMMIACARHIGHGTVSTKEGKWLKKELKGVELYGKTLGIIGIGRIGVELAKRAIAFGMKVIAFDILVKESPMEGIAMVDFDELITKSDFISLHIPFDPAVGAVLKAEHFEKMKKGVIIVNCARGGTIDEQALLDALNSGKVYSAGLDVFAAEPPTFKELIDHPKVVLTPHVGASTKEAQDKVGGEVVKVLKEFFKV